MFLFKDYYRKSEKDYNKISQKYFIFWRFLMNNMNMNMLLNMLSKMDKKDLEKGIEQANKILNSKDKNQIIDQLKNNNNKL